MRNAKAQMLIDALEPVAAENGLELLDVDIAGKGSSPLIRIYLDGPGGIGLDDLAAANQWVDAIVEELDPYTGAYTLEVSSPGIDRPLRTLAHFQRAVGEEVVLQTERLEGNRGKWTGVLKDVQGEDILLEVEGEQVTIPFKAVKRANVKGKIDFSGKDLENADFPVSLE